jgi:hypothetical protein
VWVKPELRDDGRVYWTADSDSQLTKGLAALLVLGLSGCTPQVRREEGASRGTMCCCSFNKQLVVVQGVCLAAARCTMTSGFSL